MTNTSGATVHSAGVAYEPDLLAALRRQWFTVVVIALIGALVAWFYASAQPTTYESQSTLLLVAAADEQSPGGGRERTLDVETWATVARSTALLQQVANELDLDLDDVRARSTATAAPVGDVLRLTFRAASEGDAIDGAAMYSDLFLATRQQSVNASTRERIEQLRSLAVELEGEIAERAEQIDDEERSSESSAGLLAVLIDTQQSSISRLAQVEDELSTLDADVVTGRVVIDPQSDVEQTGFGRWVLTISGLLVGALIGLILALLRDRYDDRYSTAVEPERLGIREIGRVPYLDGIAADPTSAMLAYSRLITRLAFAQQGEREASKSVLLLPIESKTLPFDAGHSVAAALQRCGDRTGVAIGLWGEDVALEQTRAYWEDTMEVVRDLTGRNDLVVVSERALDHAATGIGLAAIVDETLLIVSESTRLRAIESALDDLRGVNVGPVQVVVLTGVRARDLRGRRRPFEEDDVDEILEESPPRFARAGASYDDEY